MIICGTGHRPDKLGGYSDEAHHRLVVLASGWMMSKNISKVISGMALGWDQALAEAARDLCIPYVAYVPFVGQESRWPHASQAKFHALIRTADDLVVCNDGAYAAWKMQTRNQRMVDDADTVLALWNGTDGGTHNCVKYAEKKGKLIINLWEMYDGAGTQREAG